MANTLGAYNPTFYASEALIHLRKVLGMASRVHRGYELERSSFNRGDTISIRKPSTFTANAAPSSAQDLVTGTVNISLNQWFEVKFELTDKEWAYTNDIIIQEHIEPAAYALADKIDQDLAALYKDVPWLYDYAAATDHTVLTGIRRVAFDNSVPLRDDGMVHLMVDGVLEEGFLNSTTFHSAQVAGAAAGAALLRGMIGTRFGVEAFANQNAPTHTPGTAVGGGDTAGAVNQAAGVAIGDTSVIVDTFTGSETILAGDTFSFAGNTQKYAVTSDVTLSTGAGTINFTPSAVAAHADDTVITLASQTSTAHTQQLLFHRNAFALALAPLPDNLPGADAFTATDPIQGLSVRARRYYDGANSKIVMALDVLYGVKTLDPNLAVRGWT